MQLAKFIVSQGNTLFPTLFLFKITGWVVVVNFT